MRADNDAVNGLILDHVQNCSCSVTHHDLNVDILNPLHHSVQLSRHIFLGFTKMCAWKRKCNVFWDRLNDMHDCNLPTGST